MLAIQFHAAITADLDGVFKIALALLLIIHQLLNHAHVCIPLLCANSIIDIMVVVITSRVTPLLCKKLMHPLGLS